MSIQKGKEDLVSKARMSEEIKAKIKFINVTKLYKSTIKEETILENLTFDIFAEEFVCILGPSGSGKSTILGLVAGFILPTSGNILFNLKKITRADSSRTMVFQEYALFPWLNILDNVAFGLTTKNHNKNDLREKASEYLKLVGLSAYKEHSIAQLSGGMKQRVAIARALAVDPEVLLLDEPFGALDQQTRESMQIELLRLWAKTKKTVLFVTHSVDEALKLADRIIVIGNKPGKLLLNTTVAVSRPRDFNNQQLVSVRNKILEKIIQPELFMGADI